MDELESLKQWILNGNQLPWMVSWCHKDRWFMQGLFSGLSSSRCSFLLFFVELQQGWSFNLWETFWLIGFLLRFIFRFLFFSLLVIISLAWRSCENSRSVKSQQSNVSLFPSLAQWSELCYLREVFFNSIQDSMDVRQKYVIDIRSDQQHLEHGSVKLRVAFKYLLNSDWFHWNRGGGRVACCIGLNGRWWVAWVLDLWWINLSLRLWFIFLEIFTEWWWFFLLMRVNLERINWAYKKYYAQVLNLHFDFD